MALPTQPELNRTILEDITILKERLATQRDTTEPLADLIIKVAVLENQFVEMQKLKESWGQRGWAIIIVLLSAFFSFISVIVGILLTAQIKK